MVQRRPRRPWVRGVRVSRRSGRPCGLPPCAEHLRRAPPRRSCRRPRRRRLRIEPDPHRTQPCRALARSQQALEKVVEAGEEAARRVLVDDQAAGIARWLPVSVHVNGAGRHAGPKQFVGRARSGIFLVEQGDNGIHANLLEFRFGALFESAFEDARRARAGRHSAYPSSVVPLLGRVADPDADGLA